MKRETDTTVLELSLPKDTEESKTRDHRSDNQGLTIGTLAGFDDAGTPLVSLPGPGSDAPTKCLSIVVLDWTLVGRPVAVQFETSDQCQPIILGVIQGPLDAVRPPSDIQSQVRER